MDGAGAGAGAGDGAPRHAPEAAAAGREPAAAGPGPAAGEAGAEPQPVAAGRVRRLREVLRVGARGVRVPADRAERGVRVRGWEFRMELSVAEPTAGAPPAAAGSGREWRRLHGSEWARGTLSPEWDPLPRGPDGAGPSPRHAGPLRVRVVARRERGAASAEEAEEAGEEFEAFAAEVDLQALHAVPAHPKAFTLPQNTILLFLADRRVYASRPPRPIPAEVARLGRSESGTRLAAAAEAAAAAAAAPKPFDLEEATVEIKRLKAAKAGLRRARGRAEELRGALAARLAGRGEAQRQVRRRAELSWNREQLAQARRELEGRLGRARAALQGRCRGCRAANRALHAAGRELVLARDALAGDVSALEGPRGEGARLGRVHRQLNARRWKLVAALGRLFSVRAEAKSVPSVYSPSKAVPKKISIVGYDLELRAAPEVAVVLPRTGHERVLRPETHELVGTVLGYVAHVLQLLSAYCDIPCRYPVRTLCSKSVICEPALADGEYAEIRFPLFADNSAVKAEKGRTRLDIGIFLLNKDIEQFLNAFGLEGQGIGRRATLPNLYKLLHAADFV